MIFFSGNTARLHTRWNVLQEQCIRSIILASYQEFIVRIRFGIGGQVPGISYLSASQICFIVMSEITFAGISEPDRTQIPPILRVPNDPIRRYAFYSFSHVKSGWAGDGNAFCLRLCCRYRCRDKNNQRQEKKAERLLLFASILSPSQVIRRTHPPRNFRLTAWGENYLPNS